MSHDVARTVLEIEARAVQDLVGRLDASFDLAIELLLACEKHVVVSGMGKSGLIGQKVSATFASTGTPSLFLHPAEAAHGDLGRVVKGDVWLALSHSGDSAELVALLPLIKRLGCPLIALTGHPGSMLARNADVHLDVSIRQEACPLGLAPTASTTAALAMGDALAMTLLERRGFGVEDFAVLHPGGRLGRRLLRVDDLMHRGDAVPRVLPDAKMRDVLFEMTQKRLGITTVTEADGRLVGVISDGDLRRQMERHGNAMLDRSARECMNGDPVLVDASALAAAALEVMEARRITSVLVTDAEGRIQGVVHLHDLWKTQLV